MSEEDSREEVAKEEEEEEEEEKSEEEVKEEEGKEEEEKKGKKRGRPPSGTPAKRQKKEKGEGGTGTTKKRKKAAKKHPKTIEMVVEAIEILGDPQGSSVQAIKSYIIDNFKSIRTDMIKSMLRHALTTGLKQNVVARPKAQVDTQVMSGRYLLGKAARKEEEEEILPYKNRSPLPPKPVKKGKKKGKKGKKKASPAKGRRPVKSAKRGRK